MSIFKGEVKDGCQHLRGEIDRDFFHPVERLTNGQIIQNVAYALSDESFQVSKITGCHNTLHGRALHVVNGCVHGNKLSDREVITVVANRNGRF